MPDVLSLHHLQPNRLPDSRGGGIPNPPGFLLPKLFSPWDALIPSGIPCTDTDRLPSSRQQMIRYISFKGGMSAGMMAYMPFIYINIRLIIHCSEMQDHPLVRISLHLKVPLIPDNIVKFPLPDAAESGLEYKGNLNRPVISGFVPVPCLLPSPVMIVKGKTPSPIQVDPVPADKLRSWIFCPSDHT